MAATVTPPGSKQRAAFARPQEPEALDVSAYDRVSSLLVTVLIMLGVVVLMMFLVWLSTRLKYNPPIVPVTVVEEFGGGGSGDGAPSAEQQFEEVNPEEVQDLQAMSVDQTLQAVSDAVSLQATSSPNLMDEAFGQGGFGRGEGTGTGDGRGPGPGGPGTATQMPDWEVRFNATTLELYAQQLDFFGIELGAIGGGKKTVDYASKLSQPKPVVRTAPGNQERRRYLVWRKGPLAQADRDLLAKAGIDAGGRIVLQFLPESREQQMAVLEAQHAKGKKLSEIRRTVFGVRNNAGKFEFYVAEQEYRAG